MAAWFWSWALEIPEVRSWTWWYFRVWQDVSISTIWRTLVKIGFRMKKVSDMLILMAETHIPNSSLVPLSNIVLKSGQTSLLTLVPMRQISWSLSMRVLLIIKRLIVEGLGLYGVIKQQGNAFSVRKKGECRYSEQLTIRKLTLPNQILSSSSVVSWGGSFALRHPWRFFWYC